MSQLQRQGAKPRVSYAAFVAAQQAQQITLAALIEKFIVEMDGSDGRKPVKPLGESHRATLRKVCRLPIGAKAAAELTKNDVKDLVLQLHAEGCKPSTAQQYITYLTGVLKYAPSAWDEHEDLSPQAIEAAKPFLKKNGYIAGSETRDRRPTPEEIERLVAHFAPSDARKRTKVKMVPITLWQVRSSRRIGESCRLLWADWNREDHTILVRKMKHPTKKETNDRVVALPPKAQAQLEEMWETRDPNEPRIFPYKAKTCIKRYIMAKAALGIEGLHLHDSRADCGTRLVEDDGFSAAQACLVTGHTQVSTFERRYLRMKPELFKEGPKGAARAAAA